MSRTAIVAIGGLLWGGFAADAVVHFASGDWIPVTIATLVGAAWMIARRSRVQALQAVATRT